MRALLFLVFLGSLTLTVLATQVVPGLPPLPAVVTQPFPETWMLPTSAGAVAGLCFLGLLATGRRSRTAAPVPESVPAAEPSPTAAAPAPRTKHTIFISHSSKDNAVVRELRQALELRGYAVREDGTAFDPNKPLPTQIQAFLDESDRVLVVVSEAAANSAWVTREIRYAAEREAIDPGIHIIPLRLQGATTAHLRKVFGLEETPDATTPLQDYPAEKLSLDIPGTPPRISDILGQLIARIEGQHYQAADAPAASRPAVPLADLVLILDSPDRNDLGRPTASARLAYYAPDSTEPPLLSEPFPFTAPLGKIEADDLRFYLERYLITPFGTFTERKERIETQFRTWGMELFKALDLLSEAHKPLFLAWSSEAQSSQRRFTIQAPDAPFDAKSSENPQNHPAITEILGLPWELLHRGSTFLFQDGLGVRVRRFLPGVEAPAKSKPEHLRPPLRVLIVCSRPEAEGVGYIDHRVSTRPLVEALNALGQLATYEFLTPATLKNLQVKLQTALQAGRPYHIVHFDGHGVFDPHGGLGQLVFEAEGDLDVRQRGEHLVDAHALGENIANQGVRLFFLEACQSAKSDAAPDASVAGRLLQAGIPSVAAMSHSVLVETARQFTTVFYPALVRGERVGTAMLEGQRALAREKQRGYRWEPDADPDKPVRRLPLLLDDWFVPVLYQHREDPAVLTEPAPSAQVQRELAEQRTLLLGNVPAAPDHAFVGRSRELLAAERHLLERGASWILFRGEGGEGKTTIAAELARWLVTTNRFPRAAFASVENADDVRAILCQWGGQLLPLQFSKAKDEDAAFELLVRCLNDHPALLILDNLESILPVQSGGGFQAAESPSYEPELQQTLFARCRALLEACPASKLILTSREIPPQDSGFADRERILEIGRLARHEGMELVARVLAAKQAGGTKIDPKALEAQREEEIGKLVDLVQGHARALVLLTPELADKGLTATTEELATILTTMNARPGAGRETSLFASMELGLRRLPPGVREKILPLGVVEGGGCILAVMDVLEVSGQDCVALYAVLHSVGLAEIVPVVPNPQRASDIYLRFDPALAPALLLELRKDPEAEAAARSRWLQAYCALAGFLYEQQFEDIHLAVRLTRLELPNHLAALRRFAAASESQAAEVIGFATNLESLLSRLHRPSALREVAQIRTAAAARLRDTPWSHASFDSQRLDVEQLWAAGRIPQAVERSRKLVDRCEVTGPDVYPEAAYDLALAHFILGRSYLKANRSREAIAAIDSARQGFERLASAGNNSAAGMASRCLSEYADCLTEVGQLDAAVDAYEEAIRRAHARADLRDVAVGKFNLGNVRFRQFRYLDALRLYSEAKDLVDRLGESAMTASAWHQIGMVHEKSGNLEAAEHAYLQSLAIKVETKDRARESSSRNQLGILYDRMPGRREEAVVFYRQAVELCTAVDDILGEGRTRNNLANTLIQLNRFDEARRELVRAAECKAPFGAQAQPWKTWLLLVQLESATGNASAARAAKCRAIDVYADARREGWEITQGNGADWCATIFTVLTREPLSIPQARSELVTIAAKSDTAPPYKALIAQLLRLLDGVRDESLWQAPDLDYDDAAEILLLLERLERGDVAEAPVPDPAASPQSPEIDPAQLLPLLRELATAHNLDLATMPPEQKIGFIASILLQASGQSPESLTDEARTALIHQAARIAEEL